MIKYIFFRNDDVRSTLDQSLVKLTNIFIQEQVPINHVVEPANISEYVTLSWDYDGRILHPNEVIQIELIFATSQSSTFRSFLVENNVKNFSFNIHIVASEEKQS